jgi:hypothetical protein
MKLYVWKDVLCDHSCGLIVCVAEDLESARDAWRREFKVWMKMDAFGEYEADIMKEPIVYDLDVPAEPICHFVTGGG